MFLITNDDGVYSKGINLLHKIACEVGSAMIVAPFYEQSGKSHSITLKSPLRIRQIEEDRYSVDGSPVDSVIIGIRKLFVEKMKQKPDVILSGINHGPNIGNDILYSGTVGAAMEGALSGVPSVAFSLAGKPPWSFDTAEIVVRKIMLNIKNIAASGPICYNVNIPNCRTDELRGIVVTKVGHRFYDDKLIERQDPTGDSYYWIGGGDISHFKDIPGSDCQLVNDNYATVTLLRPAFQEANDDLRFEF